MELMQDPSKLVRPRSRNEIRKASLSDILYHDLVKAILSNETNSEARTILFEIVPSPYYGPSAAWFGIRPRIYPLTQEKFEVTSAAYCLQNQNSPSIGRICVYHAEGKYSPPTIHTYDSKLRYCFTFEP